MSPINLHLIFLYGPSSKNMAVCPDLAVSTIYDIYELLYQDPCQIVYWLMEKRYKVLNSKG